MQSWSQPASSRSEPAGSACPLCGVSVKSTALQAHVAAELDQLDKAASAATPFPRVARQHYETSTLQLKTAHVKQQQQQQQLFYHVDGVPHAETLRNGAVYIHRSSALRESSSVAGNCASDAQHWRHRSAHAASQGPQHAKNAHVKSQAAPAKQTDVNVQELTPSGYALGHGAAQKCPQHQRRQAAGMQSAAQHQVGCSQQSQEQGHTRSTSGRCSLQQRERRLHRKAGVKRNSQVTSPIEIRMQA